MLHRFEGNDPALHSEPFIHEEVRFNLIHMIAGGEEAMLVRNEEGTFIAAQTNKDLPMWVWTHDDMAEVERRDLMKELLGWIEMTERVQINGKPEDMEVLKAVFQSAQNVTCEMEMGLGSYHCPEVHMPELKRGTVRKATIDDQETVAKAIIGFIEDAFHRQAEDDRMEAAERVINKGGLYLLVDGEEFLSMASVSSKTRRHGRINMVFTPKDKRRNGYAGALVAHMAQDLLDEGFTPQLYTDLSNPSSNRCYQKVGFVSQGDLVEMVVRPNESAEQ